MNQSLMNILVHWGPVLLLIAVWMFFWFWMRSGGIHTKHQQERMAEMRRQSDALERIAKEVEKKSP